MAKQPPGQSPPDVQIYRLQQLIKSCKKFLDSASIEGITIIFSTTNAGIKSVDLVKFDDPDFAVIPVKDLFHFFQVLADNLTAKKLLLENGESLESLQAFQQALKKSNL